MLRIMIVSKHAGERERLAAILGQWPGFGAPALCRDSYDALHAARSSPPHVALVGEEPSILGCPELVSALKRWSPRTRVIVLASSPGSRAALKSVAAGAAGYLLREREAAVIPAVFWVLRGGSLLAPEDIPRAGGRGEAPPPGKPAATRAEMGVLACLGRGLSNREAAAELGLKEGTVRGYVSRLLRKAGLRSRAQIAVSAYLSGMPGGVPPAPSRAPR
jgi:DNA-binding NarL/FixJ family response regulator